MPFVTSAEKARSERKAIDVLGQEYFLSPYVGSAPKRGQYVPGNEKNDDGLPQGFLVEQPPNSITRPHFHNHEQFQLFVGGSAHMGKKAAQPFSLHYVKGYTPYGPITAGPEGVTYFTLRARWDTGAKYLPESRDLLKKSPKKHKMVAGIDVPELEDLLKFKACCQSAVMQVDAEGIGAYLYNIPPKVRAQLKMQSPGGGQYSIVLRGSILSNGQELAELSGVYRNFDEDELEVQGGADGAAVLLMQFSDDLVP
tara:strand:+ start:3054 stop:3815 length:762 start_codon:yes stop_codon:yes gene_type:complete